MAVISLFCFNFTAINVIAAKLKSNTFAGQLPILPEDFLYKWIFSRHPTITIIAISGSKSKKAFMTYIKADALQNKKLLGDRWNTRVNVKNEHSE